jgi:hypothetical protein
VDDDRLALDVQQAGEHAAARAHHAVGPPARRQPVRAWRPHLDLE